MAPSGANVSLRVEDLELGRTLTEDRAGDEVAAREAERIAVARVPAGDPDTVLAKVRAFQKAGANHVCAYFGATVEDFVPGMRTFAREVIPGLLEVHDGP